MDYKITLEETISVSDHMKAEIETDAIIYRNEFQKHYDKYLKTKSESELILVFILLQIYVECFLHQNMRHIVALEFKPPREKINDDWLKGEKRYVPEKLDAFLKIFSMPFKDVEALITEIKTKFGSISNIRNLFAHGHKVASWSDSDGNSGITAAKELLTPIQLDQTINEINELGLAWDQLLDKILSHCKALQRVEDFKFTQLRR